MANSGGVAPPPVILSLRAEVFLLLRGFPCIQAAALILKEEDGVGRLPRLSALSNLPENQRVFQVGQGGTLKRLPLSWGCVLAVGHTPKQRDKVRREV